MEWFRYQQEKVWKLTNIWKLNNLLINNKWVKDKNHNLWNTLRQMQTKHNIPKLTGCIKRKVLQKIYSCKCLCLKNERCHTSNPNFELTKLKKWEEQDQIKISREENNKIKVEMRIEKNSKWSQVRSLKRSMEVKNLAWSFLKRKTNYQTPEMKEGHY